MAASATATTAAAATTAVAATTAAAATTIAAGATTAATDGSVGRRAVLLLVVLNLSLFHLTVLLSCSPSACSFFVVGLALLWHHSFFRSCTI
jgi:hypothetical protein